MIATSQKKVMCVVGARPNFMKAAPLIEALQHRDGIRVKLIHTGQHYDRMMSHLFFEELRLPKPDMDLQVGSGSHAQQTAAILARLEPLLLQEHPDVVVVFGDVNSTVAASLCAAKIGIKVAHVEAGLRSFDRSMPEELNRIVTDHLSDFLFTSEPSGEENLLREGIAAEKVFFVGNVMVDTLLKHRERAERLLYAKKLGLTPKSYGVLTLHRPSNVDSPETLTDILDAIGEVAKHLPIVFPCHPRTRSRMTDGHFKDGMAANPGTGRAGLIVVDPLGYLEFLSLMSQARLVLTDSGGIQEETTLLGIPCITLRDNTERPVTVQQGTNMLAGNTGSGILAAATKILQGAVPQRRVPDLWDGKAAERIADILVDRLNAA